MNQAHKLQQEVMGLGHPDVHEIKSLTPESVGDAIKEVSFHTFPGTPVVVCCLTLKNGSYVTGDYVPAGPGQGDEAQAQKVAFVNARLKVWALEGYLLNQLIADVKGDEPAS